VFLLTENGQFLLSISGAYINYISFLIAILSFIIAILQTIRLKHLNKLRVNNLRAAVQNCRLVMAESYRLLQNRKEYDIENNGVVSKLRAIHSNSCVLIRSFFAELSEIDKPYNENKLKHYVSLDLITSKWLYKQAAHFLSKPMLNTDLIKELPDDTPDLMHESDKPT